jgi:uncharacterized iron-regulated protein
MRILIAFLSLLLAVNPAGAQVAGSDYKIYSTALQKEVNLDELTATVVPGQVLIFGEQHDDSIGHLLEHNIFVALHRRFGKNLVLSMEMFHRDVQYIVDEYLADQISEKNFIKEARAWETYKTDYRPAVEFAKEKGLKVVAANAPSRYTNLVTRKGLQALYGLSKEVRKNYIAPLPVDTFTGAYYDRFLEAMGGHTTPGMNLYQSQNFWDATMSYSINEAMKKNKSAVVFEMNGRFHSDYYSGLGERLIKTYKRKVTTISCFSDGDIERPDWAKHKGIADYIILTKPKAKEVKN